MTNVSFRGRVYATPSAVTILVEGTEVFSGQVGAGQPLDTLLSLATVPLATGNLAVSMSVTSGVVGVGPVVSNGLNGYEDTRNNDILVNGQAPEWPATPVNPMPGGTQQNPDWTGWLFEVSAGETITFTVDVQDVVPAWAPNTDLIANAMVIYNDDFCIATANCNTGATFNASQFTIIDNGS